LEAAKLLKGKLSLWDCRINLHSDRASHIFAPVAAVHQHGKLVSRFEIEINGKEDKVHNFDFLLPSGRVFKKKIPWSSGRGPVSVMDGDTLRIEYTLWYNEDAVAACKSDEELSEKIKENDRSSD
jgi:hypothetical protein